LTNVLEKVFTLRSSDIDAGFDSMLQRQSLCLRLFLSRFIFIDRRRESLKKKKKKKKKICGKITEKGVVKLTLIMHHNNLKFGDSFDKNRKLHKVPTASYMVRMNQLVILHLNRQDLVF